MKHRSKYKSYNLVLVYPNGDAVIPYLNYVNKHNCPFGKTKSGAKQLLIEDNNIRLIAPETEHYNSILDCSMNDVREIVVRQLRHYFAKGERPSIEFRRINK